MTAINQSIRSEDESKEITIYECSTCGNNIYHPYVDHEWVDDLLNYLEPWSQVGGSRTVVIVLRRNFRKVELFPDIMRQQSMTINQGIRLCKFLDININNAKLINRHKIIDYIFKQKIKEDELVEQQEEDTPQSEDVGTEEEEIELLQLMEEILGENKRNRL